MDRFWQCLQEFKKRQRFLGLKSLASFPTIFLFVISPFLIVSIDETIYSQEFQFHYDDLLSVRLKYQRSFRKYEGTLDLYFTYLKQYQLLFQQLHDFKYKYQQVKPLDLLFFQGFFRYFFLVVYDKGVQSSCEFPRSLISRSVVVLK
jgi:hypothetical protein